MLPISGWPLHELSKWFCQVSIACFFSTSSFGKNVGCKKYLKKHDLLFPWYWGHDSETQARMWEGNAWNLSIYGVIFWSVCLIVVGLKLQIVRVSAIKTLICDFLTFLPTSTLMWVRWSSTQMQILVNNFRRAKFKTKLAGLKSHITKGVVPTRTTSPNHQINATLKHFSNGSTMRVSIPRDAG